MKFRVYILILPFFAIITCCNNYKRKIASLNEDLPEKTIKINSSDITKDEIGDFLVLDSYIVLSNDEIIGNINRIIIDNDMIYMLDISQMIIFCYGMDGNMIYKIDRRGQGATDYIHIEDFGIDPVSGQLFIYDDYARKILVLDKLTGKYISDFQVTYAAPHKFGVINGSFFFNIDDNRRAVDKKYQNYYLLFSETGKQIDKYFLRHDAVAKYYFSGGKGHPFFYSEDKLLYNKMFDKRVYLLEKTGITPLYDIELPNQLPMRRIEEKMDPKDLIRSDYAYGLDDIYSNGQMLHFTFSKGGFVHSCFYDLHSDKILFCGARVLADVRKNLPFYSLITGVYREKFYALVSSIEIESRRENRPELFPEDLKNVQPEDNCIIAFYKIVQ